MERRVRRSNLRQSADLVLTEIHVRVRKYLRQFQCPNPPFWEESKPPSLSVVEDMQLSGPGCPGRGLEGPGPHRKRGMSLKKGAEKLVRHGHQNRISPATCLPSFRIDCISLGRTRSQRRVKSRAPRNHQSHCIEGGTKPWCELHK